MSYILETRGLSKKFQEVYAVNNVDLHIKRGEIYGLVGKNGAGKTTLLRIISGLCEPTSGDYSLFGYSNSEIGKTDVYSKLGILIENPKLFPNLSGLENLRLKAICAGCNEREYLIGLLDKVGLDTNSKKKVKHYSLGMKQRLGIAMALVGKSELLILDEPINGLDPQGIIEIRELILKIAREDNISVIVSSHILEELTKITDTIGIMNHGKLILQDSIDNIRKACGEYIEIHTDNIADTQEILRTKEIQIIKADREAIIVDNKYEASEINLMLTRAGIRIEGISHKEKSFEEFFLEKVREG